MVDNLNTMTVKKVQTVRMSQRAHGDGDQSIVVEDGMKLKKNLGFIQGTAIIIGTMIGSGIFISPRGVLEGSGSVGMSLVIWVACGVLSLLGALTYAELGTAIPLSGGEHTYLMYTFSKYGRLWGAVPAYMYDWVGIIVIRPAMVSIMCLSLGTYATQPFYSGCIAPMSVKKLVSLIAICIVTVINCASVKIATKVQMVLTVTKLIAIAVISISGIVKIAQGNTEYINEGFEDTTKSPSLVAMAFYNGLWAYDGWNNLNFVTEELKNPHKDLPRCILVGIPLTTLCYVLTNIGYFSVLSKEDIVWSDAVAVRWGEQVLGPAAWIIPVFVVLSCFGSSNGSLFCTGRLCYVASREGHMPRVLSFIHITRHTPFPAIIFTSFVAMVLVVSLEDLGSMIGFFSFAAWIFYGLTALSLIILRYTEPQLHRPYKVSIVIPWIMVIASVYLIIAPIVQDPRIEFFYAFLFIIGGFIFYVPFIYLKIKVSFIVYDGSKSSL